MDHCETGGEVTWGSQKSTSTAELHTAPTSCIAVARLLVTAHFCRLFGNCLLLKVTEKEENEAGRFLTAHWYQPIRFWLIISVHSIFQLIRLAGFTVVIFSTLSWLICQDARGNHTWGFSITCALLRAKMILYIVDMAQVLFMPRGPKSVHTIILWGAHGFFIVWRHILRLGQLMVLLSK